MLLIFISISIITILLSRGIKFRERINVFSKGAGHKDLLLMVWIFVLAGAFASSAKAMGAVDATVNLALELLPASFLLPGLFLSACVVSLCMGTSVGTIVALIPIAASLADKTELSLPLMAAAIVGGAFFGDNLSFISDTTIVATQSQGCKQSDKFKYNFVLVLPIAIIVCVIYMVLGACGNGRVGRMVEDNPLHSRADLSCKWCERNVGIANGQCTDRYSSFGRWQFCVYGMDGEYD